MTAISKKQKGKGKSEKEDVKAKISRTSFKSKDKLVQNAIKGKLKPAVKTNHVPNRNNVNGNQISKTKPSVSLKKNGIDLNISPSMLHQSKSFSKFKGEKKDLLISGKQQTTPGSSNSKNESFKSSKVAKKKNAAEKNFQSNKDYLKKLKKKDPEFYKAVLASRDVLEGTGFSDEEVEEENNSSEENNEDSFNGDNEVDEDDDSFEEMEEQIVNKKNKSLSQEEDEESDEGRNVTDQELSMEELMDVPTIKGGKITTNMIKEWKREIKIKKTSMTTFKCAEQALAAALLSVKGSEDDDLSSCYMVEGPKIFNSVVKFCLSDVAPALHKLFELKSLSDRPVKNSAWNKLVLTTASVKRYLKHIILLSKSITESSGVEVILQKGILPILPIYAELPVIGWNLMKTMINLWCTSYEKVRVLALIAIFRLIRSFKEERKEKCMKALYMSYVKNCHFTSPVSWPMINFMRMSLVELYSLDQSLAYRQAFIYIRQLALHLRNALIVQKKENVQLVYNWQFIHCIRLWAELLGKTHPSKVLQPLIYPLVQISIGAIGLMKSPKYFPLVFHVCSILTELSNSTDTFIPIMPHLLEVLASKRVYSKSSKVSVKPLQWDSIIKVSAAQINESAFSDGLIDQVYDGLLTYLNNESASIGFPELVFISTLKIKSFLSKCKVVSYCKKMKQLLDKIRENSTFVEQRRKDVQFSISDAKAIKDWEIATLQTSPPLHSFYTQWKNLKDKNIKAERTFSNNSWDDSTNSEANESILKEKLAQGSQQNVGSHLLVKRDEEDLEYDIEEEEEEKEEINNERSNKRKDLTSSISGSVVPSKKRKILDSNSDEDQNTEGDIIKEMNLSDYEESSEDEAEDDYLKSSNDQNGDESEDGDAIDDNDESDISNKDSDDDDDE